MTLASMSKRPSPHRIAHLPYAQPKRASLSYSAGKIKMANVCLWIFSVSSATMHTNFLLCIPQRPVVMPKQLGVAGRRQVSKFP